MGFVTAVCVAATFGDGLGLRKEVFRTIIIAHYVYFTCVLRFYVELELLISFPAYELTVFFFF